MGSIHGSAFVVVGIIVGAISFFRTQLRPFMYVAAALVLYGLVKLVFSRKKKANMPKPFEQKPGTAHHPQAQHRHPHQHGHQIGGHQQHKFCANCGRPMHVTYRFCPNCGYGV